MDFDFLLLSELETTKKRNFYIAYEFLDGGERKNRTLDNGFGDRSYTT
jgi:hypothetical protein